MVDQQGKQTVRRRAIMLVFAATLTLPSCGGGGGTGSPSPNPNPTPSSAPVLVSISPGSAVAGSVGFDLSVRGSGFAASPNIGFVQWNGSPRSTTFISSTELRATIPTADLITPGTASITVAVAPPPGGGQGAISNSLPFIITAQSSANEVFLISIGTDGGPANGDSFITPAITPDGRFVAFQSNGTNLVAGPSNGFSDIYVRDTCLGVASGCTPSTVRVSVSTSGTLADGNSRSPAISATGRYVAFDSSATNLVPSDTNGTIDGVSGLADVFLRDTCLGAPSGCIPTTTRVSVAGDGTQSNRDSRRASVSSDGRFVVFDSSATNLVQSDGNGFSDVFVRDTCINAPSGCTPGTVLVTLATDGGQGNSGSGDEAATPDMRYITFRSAANNLVAGDTNSGFFDVFVRDTCLGVASGCAPSTIRVNVAFDGSQSNGPDDLRPSISAQGRFVAFTSHATNLVPGDTNGRADVFVRDTCAGASGCTPSTFRASVGADGSQATNGSEAPSISATGRFVAFTSLATNLIPGGTTSPKTIFVRDTCFGAPSGCVPTTVLVGRSATGAQDNGVSEFPAISADGRWVAFLSSSTNLAPGATNGRTHTILARTGF